MYLVTQHILTNALSSYVIHQKDLSFHRFFFFFEACIYNFFSHSAQNLCCDLPGFSKIIVMASFHFSEKWWGSNISWKILVSCFTTLSGKTWETFFWNSIIPCQFFCFWCDEKVFYVDFSGFFRVFLLFLYLVCSLLRALFALLLVWSWIRYKLSFWHNHLWSRYCHAISSGSFTCALNFFPS